jgi:hypothetical protein
MNRYHRGSSSSLGSVHHELSLKLRIRSVAHYQGILKIAALRSPNLLQGNACLLGRLIKLIIIHDSPIPVPVSVRTLHAKRVLEGKGFHRRERGEVLEYGSESQRNLSTGTTRETGKPDCETNPFRAVTLVGIEPDPAEFQ